MQEQDSPRPETPANTEAPWERQALNTLVTAMLKEQRAARRWKVLIRLMWLVLASVLVWSLVSYNAPAVSPSLPHTAMVTIKGEIGDGTDTSAENIMAAMRSALDDEGSRALVLVINSPGGSPVQAGLIYDEIRRLRKLHGKPVYAVVEESCASAAYYLASAADKIYVDKASIVGSIGVLMDGFGFTGVMDKVGIERRLLTAGENKGFLDPFSPQTAKQRAHAQTMLDAIHSQFIAAVRQGRGERLKETPDMFSGLFWTGEQAVEMGLADGMSSLDGVARDVVDAPEVIDYSRYENMAERLAKRFGAAMGEASVKALRQSPVLR